MTNQITGTAASAHRPAVRRPPNISRASGLWAAGLAYTTLSLVRAGGDDESLFAFPAVFIGLAVVVVQLVFVQRLRSALNRVRIALTVAAGVTVPIWLILFIRELPSSSAVFNLFVPVVLITATVLVWLPTSNPYFRQHDGPTADLL